MKAQADRSGDSARLETPIEPLIEQAFLVREVEQRLLDLFAAGKLFGTVHTCIGQEWTGVAVAAALRAGDHVVSNHRGHGHFIAFTDQVEGLIAEVMGRSTGVCGGRGGSQHLCHRGFFSNGVQGGTVPVAAGLSFAQALRGDDAITVVFIGDGTLGEGVVYETMNLAAKWSLPLLIVLEHNLYAQSTHHAQTLAGDVEARAAAFGIETRRASTWEPAALVETAREAVAGVRLGRRPCFLCVDTYRLKAHSKGDDDRDPAEVERYWRKDPLTRYAQEHTAPSQAILRRVRARVDAAVAAADVASFAQAEDAGGSTNTRPIAWRRTTSESKDRIGELIRQSLQRNLRREERIVLIGEDVESPYGGAFKVTRGLSDEFPGRVRNMPISEALIVGLGNGLALGGRVPVCEIMFGDFLTLAADQIVNHASKFPYMYNGQVDVPVVVRTPMGGKRGYGPTHSQSLEKHFLGLPQLTLLALHTRLDPGVVYDRLLAGPEGPTIVIENKLAYAQRMSAETPPGFILEHSDERYPTTRLRPEGTPEVTVLCYGGMLPDVEAAQVRAFDEAEVIAEVICPTRLHPLDLRPIVESVARSGRLLVVEEGVGFAAFGSEVIAQLAERAPGTLRHVRRLASPPHPIPSSGPLEKSLLPNPESIFGALVEVAHRA